MSMGVCRRQLRGVVDGSASVDEDIFELAGAFGAFGLAAHRQIDCAVQDEGNGRTQPTLYRCNGIHPDLVSKRLV